MKKEEAPVATKWLSTLEGEEDLGREGAEGIGVVCKVQPKREFGLPWREAGPPNHHDDKVDSDQQVVDAELSLCEARPSQGGGRGYRSCT